MLLLNFGYDSRIKKLKSAKKQKKVPEKAAFSNLELSKLRLHPETGGKEFNIVGMVKKTITQLGDLRKAILWTSCGLVVLEVEEQGFVCEKDFPKLNFFVLIENASFVSCTQMQYSDSSFYKFTCPVDEMPMVPNSRAPNDSDSFWFLTFKFSVRSVFKPAPPV